MKNMLNSAHSRWDRLQNKLADRLRQLESASREQHRFLDGHRALDQWLDETARQVEQSHVDATRCSADTIRGLMQRNRDVQKQLALRKNDYEQVRRLAKLLKERSSARDQTAVGELLAQLKAKWMALASRLVERQRELEEALVSGGQLRDALNSLHEWLQRVDPEVRQGLTTLLDSGADVPAEAETRLENLRTLGTILEQPEEEPPAGVCSLFGDLETIHSLADQLSDLNKQLEQKKRLMEQVQSSAAQLSKRASARPSSPAPEFEQSIATLQTAWDRLQRLVDFRQHVLAIAFEKASEFQQRCDTLGAFIGAKQEELNSLAQVSDVGLGDEGVLQAAVEQQARLQEELQARLPNVKAGLVFGRAILVNACNEAIPSLQLALNSLETAWNSAVRESDRREKELHQRLDDLHQLTDLLDKLLLWLRATELTLTNAPPARPLRVSPAILANAVPEKAGKVAEKTPEAVAEEEQAIEAEMDRLGGLLAEHEEVERAMLEKQHDYEAIMKHAQRPDVGATPALSSRPTRPTSPRAAIRSPQVVRRAPRTRNDSGSSDQSGAVQLSPRAAAAADAPLSPATVPKSKPPQDAPLSPAATTKGPQLSSPLLEKLHANWRQVWWLVMQRRQEIQEAIEELVQVRTQYLYVAPATCCAFG